MSSYSYTLVLPLVYCIHVPEPITTVVFPFVPDLPLFSLRVKFALSFQVPNTVTSLFTYFFLWVLLPLLLCLLQILSFLQLLPLTSCSSAAAIPPILLSKLFFYDLITGITLQVSLSNSLEFPMPAGPCPETRLAGYKPKGVIQ